MLLSWSLVRPWRFRLAASKENANNTMNVEENLGTENMAVPDMNATDMNATDMNATTNVGEVSTTNTTTTTTTNNAM